MRTVGIVLALLGALLIGYFGFVYSVEMGPNWQEPQLMGQHLADARRMQTRSVGMTAGAVLLIVGGVLLLRPRPDRE